MEYKEFYVLFDKNGTWVMKVGQYPGLDISISKNFRKFLGEDEELYQKGRECEVIGHGIGAFAYYRRLVENKIDELLEHITNAFEEEDKREGYVKELEKLKDEYQTQKKIDVLKGIIPKSLFFSGHNPLGMLYKALSEDLHKKNEEECLEDAEAIRVVFNAVIERVERIKEENVEFTESIKKLLKK
ncbi:MAG: hypothetical protein ACFFCS_06130 [Candidatus Hodarchaeota archaeon]